MGLGFDDFLCGEGFSVSFEGHVRRNGLTVSVPTTWLLRCVAMVILTVTHYISLENIPLTEVSLLLPMTLQHGYSVTAPYRPFTGKGTP